MSEAPGFRHEGFQKVWLSSLFADVQSYNMTVHETGQSRCSEQVTRGKSKPAIGIKQLYLEACPKEVSMTASSLT